MTVFGWDASDFDWSRGPMDLGAAARDGIQFFTHKATEGTAARHQHYGAALTRARDAGIPVLGAYHVVRSAGALSSQVKSFTGYLDEATPWWRSHPNFFLQADVERWPYDNVAPQTGTAFADQLAAATGRTVVIYASKGQYDNELAGNRPLWNANYTGASGHYREIYPGDNGVGWQSYSNRTPVFWQYSDNATIGNQPSCDANAFRGTLDQLLALTGQPAASMGGFMAALTDEEQHDLWVWMASLVDPNTPPTGRPDDRFHFPPVLVRLQASVDAIAADVAAIKAAVGAMATVTLSQADRDAIIAGLAALVPTPEELRGLVDAAVKARLDGATIHAAGS